MAVTKMVECIEQLSPKQQDYIIAVCKRYKSNRDHLHRGLLPLMPVAEVMEVLKIELEAQKMLAADKRPDEEVPRFGTKFILNLIAILQSTIPYKVCENEVSIVMPLETMWLTKRFGNRVATKFYIWYQNKSHVCLESAGRNKWRVTAPKELIDITTTWLSELNRRT